MNREDILKMEAGREMDVLIAENVMGYSKMLAPTSFRLNNYLVDAGELVYVAPNGDTFATFDIPSYSSDISAAWEVVEKMRIAIVPLVGGGWAAEPDSDFDLELSWFERPVCDWATAPTAPLAICRAALLSTLED